MGNRLLKNTQMTLEDCSEEYRQFVEKFKPKKTTDDCYTPENVYKVVLDWCVEEYGIDPDNVVRPFWPGGDYERFDYPEGCTVVDNPPFSIVSRIAKHYAESGIKYFLFAPYLTNFSSQTKGCCHVIVGQGITYENGANVDTAFITNLDEYEARSVPELQQRLAEAEAINRKQMAKELPKYKYPAEVLTASMLGYMAKHGVDFRVRPSDCAFIRQLESQRAYGKTLFGSGYLLSEKAAAEKAAAEKAAAEKAAAEKAAAEKAAAEKAAATVWELSERERLIIRSLGKEEEHARPND